MEYLNKRVTIRLSQKHHKQLQQIKLETDKPLSEIARNAVEYFLENLDESQFSSSSKERKL